MKSKYNNINNIIYLTIFIGLIGLYIYYYKNIRDNFENEPTELNENKTTDKIAFLFLTYNNLKRPDIWNKFLDSKYSNKFSIYNHAKEPEKITDLLLKDKHIPEHIDTGWGKFNLVEANILMMKESLKDKNNKKFILVSDSCIPIVSFDKFYNEIMKDDKSRINIHSGNLHIYDSIINPSFPKTEFTIHSGSGSILNLKHTELLVNSLIQYKNNWINVTIADEHYIGNILRITDKDFNTNHKNIKNTFDTWSTNKLDISNICIDNNETICKYKYLGFSSPEIIKTISNKMIDELRSKDFLLIRKVNETTEIDINYILS